MISCLAKDKSVYMYKSLLHLHHLATQGGSLMLFSTTLTHIDTHTPKDRATSKLHERVTNNNVES